MMTNIWLGVLTVFQFFSIQTIGQSLEKDSSRLRIMFYNVENLFDPSDDTLKNDDEFTPEGNKHWTYYRYRQKITQIAKNIIAIGEWEAPDLIGLCEVENEKCLNDLTYNSPLKKVEYNFLHFESPDKRGIDVALLYKPYRLNLLSTTTIRLTFPKNHYPSRDILYAKFKVDNKDTIHVFVNHWPSRYGGQLKTEPKREYAAKILRKNIDSLLNISKNSKIIIMGDFNDNPNNSSIKEYLNASKDTTKSELINLMASLDKNNGTHKYKHQWHYLDQFIISYSLLISMQNTVQIVKFPWLFEPEKDGFGVKPFRTYSGWKYNGGYSDHLPIYFDLFFKN